MELAVAIVLMTGVASAGVVDTNDNMESIDNELVNTDLVQAFVVFRHGDRTPDQEELELLSTSTHNHDVFFPYGMKALTNRGKQCGYKVGDYLRRRYKGLVSELYVPEEIAVRTTDYDRTKMTALTALAALYPPPLAQQWHESLNWQPVPYDSLPFDQDDLLYWYNCPRYLWLRNKIYERPEVKNRIRKFQGLFQLLRNKTGTSITTTEQVFYLDNLFQTLDNVNVSLPKWTEKVWPLIRNVTKEEYNIELYTPELIRLAAGVLMSEIVNATEAAIRGEALPRLRLYSAHENNVAAAMAAANVFRPHQPSYGSTFSLELRKSRTADRYGISAVYLADPCSPNSSHAEEILNIDRCSSPLMCDYKEFVNLIKNHTWPNSEFRKQCNILHEN